MMTMTAAMVEVKTKKQQLFFWEVKEYDEKQKQTKQSGYFFL